MHKLAIPLLLILASFSSAQPALEVYSQGTFIVQIAEADNKLYLATHGKGLVEYNIPTGTYDVMNITNTPISNNQINFIQAFSGDTQFVRVGAETWLVVNGDWNIIPGGMARSNDGVLFCAKDSFTGKIFEYENGSLVPVSEPMLLAYQLDVPAADYHNQLYFNGQIGNIPADQTIFKYSQGVWTKLPLVSASTGFNWNGHLVFDANDNVYTQTENQFGNRSTYRLDSAGWDFIPIPDTANVWLTSVTIDSSGSNLFFYNKYDSSGNWLGSFVWNEPLTRLSRLESPLIEEPTQNTVFTYQGEFFISSFPNGLIRWNETANTFTKIDYSNTCVEDAELYSSPPYGMPVVACQNDSFYIVSETGNLYLTDTSMLLCQEIDASGTNTGLCLDNHGNPWTLENSGTIIKNITSGQTIACPGTSTNYFFVFDSLIWVSAWDSMYQLIGNNVRFANEINFSIDFVCMDGQGNLWATDNYYAQATVQRLDKTGKVQAIKSWDTGDMLNYGPKVQIDQKGNAWILSNDTLTRFSQNSGSPNLSIIKPHTINTTFSSFTVYDSTELVLVSESGIEYYQHGKWFYYDTRFVPNLNYTYSFHDNRLLFFTSEDGFIKYDLYGNFDNSATHLGGIVYNDMNGNDLQDSWDLGLPGIPVMINNNICSTNGFGQYGIGISGGNYTIKLQTPPYFICSPDSYTVSLNNNVMDTLNFACHAPQVVNDLRLTLTAGSFTNYYGGLLFVSVANNGTTISNPTVTVLYDTSIALRFSGQPVISQSPGTVSFQMNTVYPLQQTTTVLNFTGPREIDTGIWIHFQGTAYPMTDDTTPQNNIDTTSIFTLFPFDPNYKTVQPAGSGPDNSVASDQPLTYTIGFQNTGSAVANNIILVDTLSTSLDPSGFKYIASSHQNTFQLVGRVLTVSFKNISLPDSANDETNSHGFFKFSISAISDVPLNQPVLNQASIYFDYNNPIATNTVTVLFNPDLNVAISNSGNYPLSEVKIWPQPCTDRLTIALSPSFQMPAKFKMYDLTGKTLLSEPLEGDFETITVNNFSDGVYILCVQDADNKTYRVKCVKAR